MLGGEIDYPPPLTSLCQSLMNQLKQNQNSLGEFQRDRNKHLEVEKCINILFSQLMFTAQIYFSDTDSESETI